MSIISRKNYSVAVAAVERIRKEWRTHPDAYLYEQVIVSFNPATYEIISNMRNGYPPLKV